MSAQSQIFNPTLKTSQASGEGFACPTMNTASRLAIVFGASDRGMMVYDTTLGNVMFWNGAVWVPLGGGGLVPVGASLNTQVIYNNAGVLEGDAGLTFNNVTDALTIVGPATVQGLTVGKGASAIGTNTAFGVNVLAANTTGVANTGAGSNAMAAIQDGQANAAFGNNALATNVSGIGNTAVGHIALYGNVSGGFCTSVGANSAYQSTGANTTAVGFQSLTNLIAGDSNTAVGWTAGSSQLSGSNNGFFGAGSYADSNTASNSYNYGDGSVATHKFRVGDVVLGTGNVVMGTSAKGIDFSATANGSGTMTSELLNDYEEGTWVPTDASGAGLTLTVSACRYTKIGRAVTIQGIIAYPSTVSASNAVIAGLPFAYTDTALMSLSYTQVAYASLAWVIGVSGYTELYLLTPSGGNTTNATMSTNQIRFFGTYYI